MALIQKTVYLDHDNTFKLSFAETDDNDVDVVINHLGLTRVLVVLHEDEDTHDAIIIDSNTSPSAFSFAETYAEFKLGHENVPEGQYLTHFTLYDATAQNGIRWPVNIGIDFRTRFTEQ